MIGGKLGWVLVPFPVTTILFLAGYCFNEKYLRFMGGIAVDVRTGWRLRWRRQQYCGHFNKLSHTHHHEFVHDDDGYHANHQHRFRHLDGQHPCYDDQHGPTGGDSLPVWGGRRRGSFAGGDGAYRGRQRHSGQHD